MRQGTVSTTHRQSAGPGLLGSMLVLIIALVASACSGVASRAPVAGGGPAVAPDATAALRARILALPLHFEAADPAVDPRVGFVTRGAGYTAWLAPAEATLALGAGGQGSGVVRIALVGADRAAAGEGLDPRPGRAHYLVGDRPAQWRTDVPTYGRVRYRQVYPGVDLVYYGNRGEMEFDLVVAPGADPDMIRLRVDGGHGLAVDAAGDLVVDGLRGALRLRRPTVYQERDGARREVPGRYVLAGERQVRFALAPWDRSRPLVIDPAITFATYLGGGGADTAGGIARDAGGNVYVTGSTASTNFPTANALFNHSTGGGFAGGSVCFITKLNPTGSALVYSTYLGGTAPSPGADQTCAGIAVDGAGQAYVTGATSYPNFPVTANAFQAAKSGDVDAFVAKLSAAGNALLYASYFGGGAIDRAAGIAVNAAGSAWISGQTASDNLPTKLPFQAVRAGAFDAFIARFDTTQAGAASLVFSTYFGGSGDDHGGADAADGGLALDGLDNVYVAGTTSSPNLPVSAGVLQGALGGDTDAFVAKFSGAGARVYATYLGGSGPDAGNGIAVDGGGNAHVAGRTASGNFPVAGPLQSTLAGGTDAFVAKLNSGATALVFSTYLGGSGDDGAQRVAVGLTGQVFVAGETRSADFPQLGPVQPAYGGGFSDAFVAQLDAGGGSLLFASFVGGNSTDSSAGLTVDAIGNLYVTGLTRSINFPVSPSAFQPTLLGGSDVFVAKIGNPPAVSLVASILPASRSVQTGALASAFATIIALGNQPGVGCSIAPITTVSGTFTYQTTDPGTNQLTGSPDTAVDIPTSGGIGLQTFFFAFRPDVPFGPANVQLAFACANTDPAPVVVGLNTLLLSASATPVPDIVALAATVSQDGIANLDGGVGAFSVATVNVGAGDQITASASTGSANLPVTITVCQTNPLTGACNAPPSAAVTTPINTGETPTFSVFVSASGAVPFNPAANRAFVVFEDAQGITRGSTSVAIRTP